MALFQYIYKSKLNIKLKTVLTVLRTVSVFGILLLLINPKFESKTFYDEKPTLVIAVDNSESVSYLEQDQNAKKTYQLLNGNSEIQKRFNVKTFSFGKALSALDSLNFSEHTFLAF